MVIQYNLYYNCYSLVYFAQVSDKKVIDSTRLVLQEGVQLSYSAVESIILLIYTLYFPKKMWNKWITKQMKTFFQIGTLQ